ncbi:hypothetical protein TELCIR_09775 [Teladorsagia circumcincta]|uniref:SnoaL-like domain-containing protein n=1 Tax=Teladorsagia circumcincta TaxID=45464 RepID=A0A2G9UFE7_TELCI|nr:hypothetical protein TELCIR_09775 [Teladorsagia circumcincta]
MEKYYSSGDMEQLMNFYHSNAIAIDKGINAAYGRNEIKSAFEKYFNKYGAIGCEVSDVKYQGCGDYLIFHCKCLSESSKTNAQKVQITSIWRHFEGKWLISHEEYASEE